VDDPERARAAIEQAVPGVGFAATDGTLLFEGDAARAAAAASACVRAGLRVFELAPVRRTLDELYLSEVGA
jgi:hypothetical protein